MVAVAQYVETTGTVREVVALVVEALAVAIATVVAVEVALAVEEALEEAEAVINLINIKQC